MAVNPWKILLLPITSSTSSTHGHTSALEGLGQSHWMSRATEHPSSLGKIVQKFCALLLTVRTIIFHSNKVYVFSLECPTWRIFTTATPRVHRRFISFRKNHKLRLHFHVYLENKSPWSIIMHRIGLKVNEKIVKMKYFFFPPLSFRLGINPLGIYTVP